MTKLANPLRIGLVGAGNIAGKHATAYQSIRPEATVVAVADPMRELAEKVAAPFGAAVTANLAQLLDTHEVDAVDICLPHHLHADTIIAAAEAGKHVICEKPICTDLADAARIEQALRSNSVTFMAAHNQLFYGSVGLARELIRAGSLGQIYEVRINETFYADAVPGSMGWRGTTATSGGGELIDTGYHPAYLARHLIGTEPVDVTAVLSQHRLTFMEGEDTGLIIVKYKDGATSQITTSWAYPAPDREPWFTVVGSKGTLSATHTRLVHTPLDGDRQSFGFRETNTFRTELHHFAQALRHGSRPIHNQTDAIAVLRVLRAAYRSSEERRTVALAELAR